MSTSGTGQGPEFALPPDLYRLADMQTVVGHPDLRGATAVDHEVQMVLPAFVSLGRVAIAEGDNEAYDAWLEHTETFVREVQQQPSSDVPEQHDQSIAALQFYGAIHGRTDVADRLHDMLATREDTYGMNSIVRLCAENDTNPRAWIERHLDTADKRAQAWKDYFGMKRVHAEDKGQEFTTEEMRIPGSERVLKEVIDGALTNRGVLQYAQTAYDLAENVNAKKQVIERYDSALSARFGDEEADDTIYDQEAVFNFARRIMNDPDMEQDVKLYLYNQAVSLVGGWGAQDSIGGRGRLEIARTIELDEDMQATLQMLEGKVRDYSDNEHTRHRYKQNFTLATAEMYTARGQFAEAAVHLSNLNSLGSWWGGIHQYARKGGDIRLIRQADGERHMFDMAMSGDMRDVDMFPSENPQWDARLLIAEFFEHMGETPNIEKARETLLGMADEIGANPERLGDKMRSKMLCELTERLLEHDSTALELGPELISRIGQNANVADVYRLFAHHGSQEMAVGGWKHVNREQERAEREWYLIEYVGMLLASKSLGTSI